MPDQSSSSGPPGPCACISQPQASAESASWTVTKSQQPAPPDHPHTVQFTHCSDAVSCLAAQSAYAKGSII
jgi:hypothetical protein